MQGLALFLQGGFQLLPGLVGAPTDLRPLLFGQFAQAAEDPHDGRTAAQVLHPPLVQRILILDLFQLRQGLLFDLIKVCQHIHLHRTKELCSSGGVCTLPRLPMI